jgi:hypothetical protein
MSNEANINEKVILIRISRLFHQEMAPDKLYEELAVCGSSENEERKLNMPLP